MNEETARYLASYLEFNVNEFMYTDEWHERSIDIEELKKVILRFFKELP